MSGQPEMIARADSEILADLIGVAEKLLLRPALADAELPTRLAALRVEIMRAKDRPADSDRLIDDEAVFLCQALRQLYQFRHNPESGRAIRWGSIAGVLLPHVRADAARALMARASK